MFNRVRETQEIRAAMWPHRGKSEEDALTATAEKHYTVRPLELLALHHERIDAWILEQAGIVFVAKA